MSGDQQDETGGFRLFHQWTDQDGDQGILRRTSAGKYSLTVVSDLDCMVSVYCDDAAREAIVVAFLGSLSPEARERVLGDVRGGEGEVGHPAEGVRDEPPAEPIKPEDITDEMVAAIPDALQAALIDTLLFYGDEGIYDEHPEGDEDGFTGMEPAAIRADMGRRAYALGGALDRDVSDLRAALRTSGSGAAPIPSACECREKFGADQDGTYPAVAMCPRAMQCASRKEADDV